MTIPTWTITNHEYLNFLYSDTITPEEDYFLRLRHHHRNLLALPEEEKIRLLPTFEGQLGSLVKEITYLRKLPGFYHINKVADLLLPSKTRCINAERRVMVSVPQTEVNQACKEREAALGRSLKGWEREIIEAHLTNDRMKAATPEERLSIPDFKKVIYFYISAFLKSDFIQNQSKAHLTAQ